MKKLLICISIIGMLFIPINSYAKEYKTKNLEESLLEENIQPKFSNYEENEDQAIIYMFRGDGCNHCQSFLSFLNDITEEYGKYFRLVSYETWSDQSNNTLMKKVSNYLKANATGVPFIIIGNTYYKGYDSARNEDIKKAIMKEYENNNENDVLVKMANSTKDNKPNTVALLIFAGVVIVVMGTYVFFQIKKK